MARYDVYRARGEAGYVLDVQSNFLEHLTSRVVIPLQLLEKAPPRASRLNPTFRLESQTVVLSTQFISAVPRATLSTPVAHLGQHADEIQIALDFLLTGF